MSACTHTHTQIRVFQWGRTVPWYKFKILVLQYFLLHYSSSYLTNQDFLHKIYIEFTKSDFCDKLNYPTIKWVWRRINWLIDWLAGNYFYNWHFCYFCYYFCIQLNTTQSLCFFLVSTSALTSNLKTTITCESARMIDQSEQREPVNRSKLKS